jgi:sugar/nucleoside kinase (ribokinase family)
LHIINTRTNLGRGFGETILDHAETDFAGELEQLEQLAMSQEFCVWLVGSLVEDTRYIGSERVDALGGFPTFASAFLGDKKVHPTIVSKVGEEFPEEYLTSLIQMGADLEYVSPARWSTAFSLHYHSEGGRTLHMPTYSGPIEKESLPLDHPDLSIVSPVYHEVPSSTFIAIADRSRTVALDPQGYFRHRSEADSSISLGSWQDDSILRRADILKVSEDEVRYLPVSQKGDYKRTLQEIHDFAETPIILITRGPKGVIAADFRSNHPTQYSVPAAPCRVVDETGAGDLFLSAFTYSMVLLRKPLLASLTLGVAAASILIEQKGLPSTFPDGVLNSRAEIVLKKTEIETEI